MSRRTSIYLQDKTIEVLEIRGAMNTSDMINKFVCRYDMMIRRDMPMFSEKEYVMIFNASLDLRFSTNIRYDVICLPGALESAGLDAELVDKVSMLTFEHRVALIDLIERSQLGEK